MAAASRNAAKVASTRWRMQVMPGLLPALSHFGHEPTTIKDPNPKGDGLRGNAPSGKLHLNAPSLVGSRQSAPCISSMFPENVKVQVVIRQQRQAPHEARREGPPRVKPGPLRKLPEDDVGCDALPELAELKKELHLNSQHVLELWTQRQRASWSPNLSPI